MFTLLGRPKNFIDQAAPKGEDDAGDRAPQDAKAQKCGDVQELLPRSEFRLHYLGNLQETVNDGASQATRSTY